jgi:hypothetical protein
MERARDAVQNLKRRPEPNTQLLTDSAMGILCR